MNEYVIGIDIGTQGARVALIQTNGFVIASASVPFTLTAQSREEQSPDMWWDHTLTALQKVSKQISKLIPPRAIKAIATTSTSGTVIPINENGQALHPALMYSDQRSLEEGRRCQRLAKQHNPRGFTGFNASSGLSKICWFSRNYPEKAKQVYKWIHAADFITGKLCGRFDVTDYTNALKTGYDVGSYAWPSYLDQLVPRHHLQEVVASGTIVGKLQASLAKELQIPEIEVVVGLTDGCASQMASGAIKPGDWNTTIGTTMVIKGVTEKNIIDPSGSIYCHRHPEGFWMPGGASNTGADWVSLDFNKEELPQLNEQAAQLMPSSFLAWPLRQKGERFPFTAPHAKGFAPQGLSKQVLYTANMEGVAYIERYAYEQIERLSSEPVRAIFTAGGASNSASWLRIRSNVLNKPIYKGREATGVLGAAICAASQTTFRSLTDAVKQMTQIEEEVFPEESLSAIYEENYHKFIQLLIDKQYLAIC
ncbi:FGGY-family carbohydrate kinase [Olivibacter sp. CPCC 100613]|uniref:FGGY-family carbohydrate kinase n=1 Tax=Olivibacter sp. CPCC 100613 TaxID=3079931 RepID=UPI002FF6560C